MNVPSKTKITSAIKAPELLLVNFGLSVNGGLGLELGCASAKTVLLESSGAEADEGKGSSTRADLGLGSVPELSLAWKGTVEAKPVFCEEVMSLKTS